MLKIHDNFSLKDNTTFGVDIAAAYYTEPSTAEELVYAVNHARERNWKYYITGEGSNLLFTEDYGGLIIHPLIKGVSVVDTSDSEVLVKAGAGENWDRFVAHCVGQQWYGSENLSLIPGSVGAAPVQNIGAYGVEAKDIIAWVEVINTRNMQQEVLSNTACEFGYRDSIFKHADPEKYIVTGVVFSMKKNAALMLDYGNVKELFSQCKTQDLQNLRETIIDIRSSKLPDPEKTGNAGSFFKNPVISADDFEKLRSGYAQIPNYPAGKGRVKIPAAWLIETAGWKGKREGDVGTWSQQPLVIVNYGNATGQQIFDFSERIRMSILEKFGIGLDREVTVIS
jgi:UDP-N-acetylmuramate dehydrogenase